MDVLTHVLAKIQTAVWGPPTLFLLMGTGLFFHDRVRWTASRKNPKSIKVYF